jgi:predicted phosphodiesterase
VNALVVSDLHAHTHWPFSQVLPNGRPSRFQDLLDVLEHLAQRLEQDSVDDLLILGDLTHRRHFISFKLLNPLWDALYGLAARVRHTTILVGNHDYEDDTTHSLHVLRGLPNTRVIDEPGTVTLADGEAVFALPYLHDPRVVADAVERAPSLPLIGHYGAEGCPLETDYWLDSPLKLGELDRFPLTLFGHIHKPSEQLNGRVVYVGAPMHFDFGDHGPRFAVRVRNGWGHNRALPLAERILLHAPQMVTAKWPRIPLPPAEGGYLRLLDIPGEHVVPAHEEALRLGWRGCLPVERGLPEPVREAVLSGLAVNEDLLVGYVARTLPDASPEEQRAVVQEGLDILTASRQ